MKVSIRYSSVTGNTKRLAERLASDLCERNHDVILKDVGNPPDVGADVVILAFWCRKSSLDDKSIRFVSSLHGKKIIAIGTVGGRADDSYGCRVEDSVRQVLEKCNTCFGVLVVQGSVNMKGIERRRMLNEDDPRYVDEQKYARLLGNQGRPHEQDIQDALEFVHSCLRICEAEEPCIE